MLAVRQRHRAFGRGQIRILHPGNRKILAFLREFEAEGAEETILCVSNLSRTAQAVELDLVQFSGRTPVDLLSGSVFPPIGQLSYLLTLPHHAFYWFNLAKDTAMPAWRVPAPEPLPELVTLVMRNEIGELLAPEPKRIIEQEILAPYLARRRWFAAKDRNISSIGVARADAIRGRARDFVLFEIGVTTEGAQDRYFLPAGIVWEDEEPPAIVQQLALARVRQHRRMGFLTDAFAVDALPAEVLASLAKGRVEPLPDGELRWLATSQEIPSAPPGMGIHRLSAEQSNTSLILGEIAVMKILRRVQAGRHPQTEMTRYLTEHGYANSPALFGEMVRVDADGTPQTLLIAERFVHNQGDAWQWTLDRVRRGIHAPALTGTDDEAGREAIAAYQPFARVIGKRVAEMHAVLASPTDDPAFTPERVGAGETKAWATATGRGARSGVADPRKLHRLARRCRTRGREGIGRAPPPARGQDPGACRGRRRDAEDAPAWGLPSRSDPCRRRRCDPDRLRGRAIQAACGTKGQRQSVARRSRAAALVRLCRRDDRTRAGAGGSADCGPS